MKTKQNAFKVISDLQFENQKTLNRKSNLNKIEEEIFYVTDFYREKLERKNITPTNKKSTNVNVIKKKRGNRLYLLMSITIVICNMLVAGLVVARNNMQISEKFHANATIIIVLILGTVASICFSCWYNNN